MYHRTTLLLVVLLAWLAPIVSLRAQTAAGSLEGRVTNPATGTIVERARITVEGTNLEAFSDADGYYRLLNVPAGTAQVRASFSGFPPATATVSVTAGQATTRDFELAPFGTRGFSGSRCGSGPAARCQEMSARRVRHVPSPAIRAAYAVSTSAPPHHERLLSMGPAKPKFSMSRVEFVACVGR